MFTLFTDWWKRDSLDKPNAQLSAVIAADGPIRQASQDLLARTTLARRIAEIVAAPASGDGRVLAIRGSWGHGKTSLKNLVIEAMGDFGGEAAHLDFNPWQWGDGDAIARALFVQMASVLRGSSAPDAVRRARSLRRYGSVLVGGESALNMAGGDKGISWLASAGALAAGVGIAAPSLPIKLLAATALGVAGVFGVAGRLLNYLGANGAGTSLEDLRTDVEERLRDLKTPLVVFVDDIDRLEPEQIRLLFRQIKVNANLPNIVFVLLFQPSIVETALTPIAAGEGRHLLEKIVQAHFDLPAVAPERLFQIFGFELSLLVDDLAVSENGFDQTRWGNVAVGGISPFISNLRDVRRLLTSIEIHLPLHRGRREFEVNLIDFLALETLRVFEPSLHAALSTDKDLLVQSRRFSGDGREHEQRAAIATIISFASEERRDLCKNILKLLFPTIEWALGGMFYADGGEWRIEWNESKRVCTTRNFDRYFHLQANDGAITASDFRDFIDAVAVGKVSDALLELQQRGALPALAVRLDESVKRIPLDKPDKMLAMLLFLGEELSSAPGTDGPFNTPFVSSWRAASWYLHRIDVSDERARLLDEAMTETRSLATSATLISLDLDARAKPDSNYKPMFSDDALSKLQDRWVEIVRDRAENDASLLENDSLLRHLYRWHHFVGSAEEPKTWVQTVASDPVRLPSLLARFMSVGQQSSSGDHVATKTEEFRRETIEEFFDLDELARLLSVVDRSALDTEHARVLGVLDQHMDAWKRGENTGIW